MDLIIAINLDINLDLIIAVNPDINLNMKLL